MRWSVTIGYERPPSGLGLVPGHQAMSPG